MTSEILVAALDSLDELSIITRTSGGPILCIFLDAHDTRLQVTYLVRVNRRIIDNNPAWMSSIFRLNSTAV